MQFNGEVGVGTSGVSEQAACHEEEQTPSSPVTPGAKQQRWPPWVRDAGRVRHAECLSSCRTAAGC